MSESIKPVTPGKIREFCVATKQHLIDLKQDGITTDADIRFGTILMERVIKFIDENGR